MVVTNRPDLTRTGISLVILSLVAAATFRDDVPAHLHAALTAGELVLCITGMWLGLATNQQGRRSGWWWAVVGLTWYCGADLAWLAVVSTLGEAHPLGTVIWSLGLVSALLVFPAMRRLFRLDDETLDDEARLDSLVMALGLGFVGWKVVLAPQLAAAGGWDLGILWGTTYWALALTIFAVALSRGLRQAGTGSPSLWAVCVAALLSALSSMVYWAGDQRVPWAEAPLARPLGALAMAAMVLAVAHPSMRDLTERSRSNVAHAGRIALLVISVAIVPTWTLMEALGVVAPDPADLVGSIAGVGVVLAAALRLRITLRARDAADLLLVERATRDDLTGLPNRNRLIELLEEARGSGAPFGVLFLDLDRFKVVNDSLGHATGDQLLIAVADRLVRTVGPLDAVARLGGDEFVILTGDAPSSARVAELAGRLCEVLDAPIELESHQVSTRASIGVALGDAATEVGDVLRDADTAMYRAKAEGRNGFAIFDASLRTQSDALLTLESQIRAALADDDFGVEYQPLIDAATGHVVGAEALLRWRTLGQPHASGLTRPPTTAELVAVAEEAGLIGQIGEVVLDVACRDLARLIDLGFDRVDVGINVSGNQLRKPGFADSVALAAARHAVPPSRLVIELTESIVVDDIPTARTALRKLRSWGVTLAMDDFGTGYSALATLTRVPLSIVKIDRGFVSETDTPAGLALVHAIIGMARALDLRVVAEGIESEVQAKRLTAAGCEMLQGFHLGTPMPIDQLIAVLERERDAVGQVTSDVTVTGPGDPRPTTT